MYMCTYIIARSTLLVLLASGRTKWAEQAHPLKARQKLSTWYRILAQVFYYRTSGNIGGELNLAVWRSRNTHVQYTHENFTLGFTKTSTAPLKRQLL